MREVKLDHVRGIIRVVHRRYSHGRKTTSSRDTFAKLIWGLQTKAIPLGNQPPSQWQIKSFCWHPYTKKSNVILVMLRTSEVSHASLEKTAKFGNLGDYMNQTWSSTIMDSW